MGAVSLQQRRKLHALLDDLIDDKSSGAEGAFGFLLLREVMIRDHTGDHRTLAARGWVGRSSIVLPAVIRKISEE